MTRPEVDFVLSAIDTDWPGSETSLADVPLERIDQDNSWNLDKGANTTGLSGNIHDHADSLQGMTYVMARSATWSDEPLGTEYDHETERIVGVRVEAATALGGGFGAIDPNAGTADAVSRTYPTTTWDSLTMNIRDAILAKDNREYPSVGRSDAAFKDLRVENWSDDSATFSAYYLLTFDCRFTGFETLPT